MRPSILEILSGADQEPVLPLPEVQVLTLQEVFARYEEGCPFKPGDIVTPRKGYAIHGAGKPHVVLSVGRPPIPQTWPADPMNVGLANFGARLDFRFAGFGPSGNIAAWFGESWQYEPWTGEGV